MEQVRYSKIFQALIILLILLRFFFLAALPGIPFVLAGYAILFYFYTKNISISEFWDKLILAFLLFLGVSLGYSVFVNDENIFPQFMTYYPFVGILYFYVLKHLDLTYYEVKKLLLIFSLCMAGAYIFQWQTYPQEWFSGITNIREDEFRMRFCCTMCCYLLTYYGINQYITNGRIISLIMTVIGITPILVMGFRSLTVATVAGSLLMIIYASNSIGSYAKYLVLIVIAAWIGSQTPLVTEKIDEMSSRNETETFSNDNYVRLIGMAYYEDIFSDTPIMRLCGGGFAKTDTGDLGLNSSYDMAMEKASSFGFFWNDLGMIGFSFIIGPITVLIYLIIILKCIIGCKSKEDQFIRFALIATTMGSIMTSEEIFRRGNLFVVGILIYIVYSYQNEYPEESDYKQFRFGWFEDFYNA